MPDTTATALPRLQSHRLSNLEIQSGTQAFVFPSYAGFSIINIPSTICRLFNIPGLGAEPLSNDLISPIREMGDIRKIILIVVDALALHRLQRWMIDGTAPVWQNLADKGFFTAITSIVPSTTSAALTSLWTGRSPTEHGITGYEMWMKEYGLVINTILHSPMSFKEDTGSLVKAGFDPQKFLAATTLGTHLESHNIPTFALQHRSIISSGLSKMFFQDVKSQGFYSSSDLWVNLRQLLENRQGERFYAYVYWSEIDSLGHRYGPDDERTASEFSNLSHTFERLFLNRLSREARQDTLLLLTADHGQITTHRKPAFEVYQNEPFWQCLHIQPTGENRLAYLYLRPGQSNAISQVIEENWPGQFSLVSSAEAVEAGLFGPGTPHTSLLDRLGDTILVSRDTAYLWWGKEENHLVGRHGGLHPEEMLVPFLAVQL
jgi:hypothetical protein